MMTNTALLAIAKKQLGNGGSKYRKYVGADGNYCNMFVYWLFNANGCASLLPLPKTNYMRTYCPSSIKWCRKNLAEIPPYLAMACDIIYMDWEPNGVPNHIGIVDHKISTTAIATIEGNTSGKKNGKTVSGIVAAKTRNTKYTNVFRPHFKGTYKKVPLTVDGDCGYQTIGGLQTVVGAGVDTILGLNTVKKVQAWAGTKQDGSWGKKTSLAVQIKLAKAGYYSGKLDSEFGKNSVIGLQKWINNIIYSLQKKKPSQAKSVAQATSSAKTTNAQKIIAKAKTLAWSYGTAKKKYAYKTGAPTKLMKAAMKKYGWADNKAEESDCGNAASTIVRESGVDKSFKALHGVKTPFPTKESKFNIPIKGRKIKSDELKPGDIIRYKKKNGKQHAMIYMGDGRICEASHYSRFCVVLKDTKKYNKVSKVKTIQVLRAKE